MAKSITSEKIVIGRARLAFANAVFEAQSVNGGPPQYGCTLLLPPTAPEVAQVRAEEDKLAALAWPQNHQAMMTMIRANNFQALKPGDLKAKFDGFAGNFFISTNNKVRPTVVNRNGTPLVAADGVIYSGCYVLAHISLWTQDNQFGQKINANLLGLQFLEDGDAFSGGATVSDPSQFSDLGAGPEADVAGLMS